MKKKTCVAQYSKRQLKERGWLRYTYNIIVDDLHSGLFWHKEVSLISIVNSVVKETENDFGINVDVFIDREMPDEKMRNEVFVNFIDEGGPEKIVEVHFIFQGKQLVSSQFLSPGTGCIFYTEKFNDAHELLIRNYHETEADEMIFDEGGQFVDVSKRLVRDYKEAESNN